jgi:rare lipoprotein A
MCAAGGFLFVGQAQAEVGLASWYGQENAGQLTASGAPYDPYGYTAAHKDLTLGTELVVSYEGLSVPVTVNDRGPYVGEREIDLSLGAAQYLGLTEVGVDYVDYQYTGFDPTTNLYATGAFDPQWAVGVEQYAAEDQYGVDAYYGIVRDPAVYAALEEPVAAAPVSEATPTGGAVVVQPGDNLITIAAILGTTPEALAAINGIPDPNLIYAGQTLYY